MCAAPYGGTAAATAAITSTASPLSQTALPPSPARPRCTDAGPLYNPNEAYDAHRSLFKGQILMGVEVPPEAWGGHVITLEEARNTTAYIRSAGGDGMMIWSLQKSGIPSAQALSAEICNTLGMGGCATPLFP